MLGGKRNEWLDAGDSDEEQDLGYDSERAEESKVDRRVKRRRIDNDSGGDSDLAEEDGDEDHTNIQTPAAPSVNTLEEKHSPVVEARGVSGGSEKDSTLRRIRTPSPETTDIRALSRSTSATNPSKTGVIYISRVPPYMQPSALRTKLEPFGTIGRIFLQPEDPLVYARRKKSGGNKKRSFTDGWVEFLSKKDAKLVAEALNAQIIGGKKGSWYHDDVWNIKYLKGFKWHHLTEQIANETAERNARLRTEISHATKENKRFIEGVETAKMLGTIQKREQEKAGGSALDNVEAKKKKQPFKREFKQNEAISKRKKGKDGDYPGEAAQRVLSRIF